MERGRRADGRIVIVGAGVVGASVAHHLTRLGHDDVLVLDAREPGELPGSTGLAPGFVGRLSATPELTVLAEDSVAGYRALDAGAGAGRSAFREVGCLEVATGGAGLERAHRGAEHGRRLGIEARVLGPEEAVALAPGLVDAGRARGALYVPGDGAVDPVLLTHRLVAAAQRAGAQFRFGTRVAALECADGRVTGVRPAPDGAVVAAGRVVLAAGIWGPVLAATAGVRLPMVAVRHPYLYTCELPGMDGEFDGEFDEEGAGGGVGGDGTGGGGAGGEEPGGAGAYVGGPADGGSSFGGPAVDRPIVRYPEHGVYTRRHGRRYGLGSYAHAPLPLTPSADLLSAELPFREADFGTALAEAKALVPVFRAARVGRGLAGVFAMTPDELPLAGPAPGVAGLWCAEASWVTHAGGVGRQVARMLLGTGELLVDPDRLAPGRFASLDDRRIHEAALAHYRGIYEAH